MKKLILILLTLSIVSCKQKSPTENTLLSPDGSYLPLQVGNEWIYNYHFGNTDTTKYIKVIGTKKINNNDYFIVVNNIHFLDTNYLRTKDGLKYYIYKENKDFIFRIFKDTIIEKEDSYDIYAIKSKIQIESSSIVRTGVGKYSNYIEVEEGEIALDGGTMFYYVKDIGLVYSLWPFGNISLVYAKVNDVEYGEK